VEEMPVGTQVSIERVSEKLRQERIKWLIPSFGLSLVLSSAGWLP